MSDLLSEFSNFRSNIRRQYESGQNTQTTLRSLILEPQQIQSKQLARGASNTLVKPNGKIDGQIEQLKKQVSQQRTGSTQQNSFVEKFLNRESSVKKNVMDHNSLRSQSHQSQVVAHSDSTEQPSFLQKYLQSKQQEQSQLQFEHDSFMSSNKENVQSQQRQSSRPKHLDVQKYIIEIKISFYQEEKSIDTLRSKSNHQALAQRSTVEEMIPVQSLQRIQDILIDASDNQFNDLSLKYIEELIRVSCVITYRVKNSKFYKQVDL